MTPGQATPPPASPRHPDGAPPAHPLQKPRLTLKLATLFALASSLYFALSHYLLSKSPLQGDSALNFELAKDALYVGFATLILAAVLRHFFNRNHEANQRLLESETRLNLALSAAHQGAWDWNLQSNQVFFSPEWTAMLGYKQHELSSSPDEWKSRVHPDDLPIALNRLDAHFKDHAQPYNLEHRIQCKDGTYRWILTQGEVTHRSPSGQPLRMSGTHTDITGPKRFEAALQESEDRYRHLVEESPDAIGIYQNEALTFINSTGLKLLGATSSEQVIGRRAEELIHPDDMPDTKHRIQKRHAGDKSVYPAEVRYRRTDGSYVDVEVIASPTHFDGQTGIQFIARDISERKRTEKAFREQKEIFTSVVTQASDSIVIIDETTGQFVEFNTAAHQDLGYSREEFATLQVKDFQADDSPDVIRQRIQQASDHGPFSFETRHRHKDGSIRNVRVRLQHLNIPGRHLLAAVWTDITNQILLETQLRQSQKIEAVGQLAGGVAHDFNNILAAITMNLGMLKMKPGLDEELTTGLQDLSQEARRAAALTRQLLMFSRRSVLTVTPINLNDIIDNLLKMLHRLIGEHIELIFDGKSNLHPAMADVGMMEQIIVNLAVNARDAMPNGGTITLATSNTQFTADELESHPDRRPGPFVRLTVTDTGAGIPPEIIPKIFDPFFTTKEQGKGSGLGLSTIHGIVAQHRGWIEVSSQPQHGSTFSIYLPASPKSTANSTESLKEAKPQRGTESLLIVEDEPALRNAMAKSLRALGYQVATAPNAPEALNLWNQHQHQFDLLITDMVMPKGITGLQLAEQLQQQKPSLKIIISSGYSAQISQAGIPNKKGIAYLPKPYEFPTLAHTIRTQLNPQ